jgi:hypothetical protein
VTSFVQVKNLGCDSFALLFDDIETTMNEADKTKFASFAVAQLTVSNDTFEYLGCPQFFFCPTGWSLALAIKRTVHFLQSIANLERCQTWPIPSI